MQPSQLRERLVATLRERGALHDAAVERAFLTVPRETFVPGLSLDAVYRDDAILTKVEDGVGVSSSSQPAIMALMLEQLDVFAGARVLEIGAGTGYNAALLRELVGDGGDVVTVDIDEEVAGWASARLSAAGYPDVLVRCADGADGWAERAPYDRIELTVGSDDVASAWHAQLVDGGILIVPLWVLTGQISVAFERRGDSFESRSVQTCGFVALRGSMAASTHLAAVADGVIAAVDNGDVASEVRTLLNQPAVSTPWDDPLMDGFAFFAGLWGLTVFSIFAGKDASSVVLGGGMALLDRERHGLALVTSTPRSTELRLLTFGDAVAAGNLRSAFERWSALGRPDVDELEITAYPLESAPHPEPDAIPVDTRLWRLLFVRRDGSIR